MMLRRLLLTAALIGASLRCEAVRAANWSVERVNHVTLAPPAGVTVQEMSGVTYLGPAGDAHRFLAAEEGKGEFVQFDVTLDASGAITAVANIAAVHVNSTADFEGIAYTNPTRNSVFLSDEQPSGPGLREFSLATGLSLQTIAVPTVFTANERSNRGFESLTRSLDATEMWTANEEALTVDGGAATPSAPTTVRLLHLNVEGHTVTAGAQFAYIVDSMHGPIFLGQGQSGLADLTAMPDGTLLAMERSLAGAAPPYLNRIYEVSIAGATDVSTEAFANGLVGQSYTPTSKQLLWSGAADGINGQNLEGLTLGPRLANGSWVLLGVVDNGDALSANTIVAFVATANPSADFNADGEVNGADLLAWQRGVGTTIGARLADGDADRDGDVDAADLEHWKAAASADAIKAVPEPESAGFIVPAAGGLLLAGRRNRTGRRRLEASDLSNEFISGAMLSPVQRGEHAI
jgi:hypothetical protein